jgi:hypothetical protein
MASRRHIIERWMACADRSRRPAASAHACAGRSRTPAASALCGLLLIACAPPACPQPVTQALPEYRLKAAVLYNFALFTDWPADTGSSLNLCVYGADPFGEALNALQDKPVGDRFLAVRRAPTDGSLADCQIVFIAPSAIAGLPHLLGELRGRVTLTVADSPDAARHGVALNMSVAQNKVSFEANLSAARGAGLNLSSKLLRLATQVIQ